MKVCTEEIINHPFSLHQNLKRIFPLVFLGHIVFKVVNDHPGPGSHPLGKPELEFYLQLSTLSPVVCFSIVTLMKSSIWFTVHVGGRHSTMLAMGVWGRGGPVRPTPWMRLGRTGCTEARAWLRHSCLMSGGAGRCVLVEFTASLSSELVSHLSAWPEDMVTHQPISASFIVPGKPPHQISSVGDTDGNFGIKSLLLLLVALEPPHPHWQGQAKDSCMALEKTSAALLS